MSSAEADRPNQADLLQWQRLGRYYKRLEKAQFAGGGLVITGFSATMYRLGTMLELRKLALFQHASLPRQKAARVRDETVDALVESMYQMIHSSAVGGCGLTGEGSALLLHKVPSLSPFGSSVVSSRSGKGTMHVI
ncbi:hypothetical protein [Rhizobium sophoriradicis]|uniref:Uncharacterized protein n=1 Tax=Rhizobium sophoriradicis TaxID=1535245 RepID=A0A2A5KJH8_9HYPH|nr:hypothetical protein [Rhizobium sophoriradicis]PCK77190.1 hypothetical protein CPT34_31370 [Rhizobium sophoriradicis]